jgi:catechol 2,3-dioxygenase-like lactoylglutathione lyase family enzyme
MKVMEISWVGIVSADVDRDRDFMTGVLGLSCELETDTFTLLRAANGDVVELFRDTDPTHEHFRTGPVPGLRVDQLDAALEELTASGAELLGEICVGSKGNRWVHFRAPDGTVFELIELAGESV